MTGAGESPRDEELVRRIQAGDEEAARILFDRHVAELRARVRRRLPALLRRKVAESDVVQEAYVAAFASLAEFDDRGKGSFSGWIGGILEHKILEEVRRHLGTAKRSAHREISSVIPEAAPREPEGPGPSPSLAAMTREAREDVVRVLRDLPEGYREVLRLVHREGLALRDAAQCMGRSEAAVRKLYQRAVRSFEDALEKGSPGQA